MTSLVGGGLVWLWERGRRTGALNRKAAFFGVRPGETCLIVLGSKYNTPGTAAHRDVRAAVELAMLAGELGCRLTLESGDFRGGNGDRTEFCVGGPLGNANIRTGGHLAAYLPGMTIHPWDPSRRDSVAFEVGGRRYFFDKGNEEYAIAAKFTPEGSRRPVFLVCGQSSLGNQAAIHFLRREYAQVARTLASVDRYCVLIKVSGIATYEHHRAVLERDVSAAAFGSG
ncbi:hypothetical protein RKE29_20255 [Streptomyces sp. B1866]|uniref:hypothetical protein n=1 Tax=Streptomyces sp. B1866 TaxID=3075431 RepID=UPI00288F4F7B|nr:hypothetical protein [Streptomyces sp. B1866]MDT3398948.1 hypothetical protein [Streptomyces sp. B1866]